MASHDGQNGHIGQVLWLSRVEELRDHIVRVGDCEDYAG